MNPVVHWELFAKNAPSLGSFYAELFGWTLQPLPDIGYVLIDTHAGVGINGGILTVADGPRTPMFYLSVGGLKAALDRVERAGGAVTLAPVTEVVSFAQFLDPEAILWDCWSGATSLRCPRATHRFHTSTSTRTIPFGFSASRLLPRPLRMANQSARLGDHDLVFNVDTGAGGITGTIGRCFPGTSPVTFYASVLDPHAYLERARALGGTGAGLAGTRVFPSAAAYLRDPEGQTVGLLPL